MIIVRAPLRISLGGGGTDLPSWYERHGSCFISASIDKYIYMTGSERLVDKKIWLSYSQNEICDHPGEIKHSSLRACLNRYHFETGIEIHSISEVPGNSGMGSSGAFLVGCLTLLNAMEKIEMTRQDLAELACHIEVVDLGKSSGKQDQYASAIGGISRFTINPQGEVMVEPLHLGSSALREIESSLFLYYSGVTRNSEPILSEQAAALRGNAGDAVGAMHRIQEIGIESGKALEAHDLDAFGELLHQHWLAKKMISSHMSDASLDKTYDFARSIGATGGKLIGAGGGGYWMFHVPPEKQRGFRARIGELGLLEMPWKFDFHGCSVIYTN
jgi:D-glycero-alpha-D-manno-heptose-7-phosphate kinase